VDEKRATEELSVASAHAHPTHDPDGGVWIHPTPDQISGPNALRRVDDKMSVLSYQSQKLPVQLTDNRSLVFGGLQPWPAYLIGVVEMAERFSYYVRALSFSASRR